MSTIEIAQLSKSYGDVAALDKVTIDVNDGEFLTVLGPSGSGKTTLLLTIAGFEFPDQGAIRIDSKDITNMPAYKREIGLTFQSYALFPHMSVEDNVGYALRVRRVGKKERRELVRAALQLVQLEGMERRRPHQLSGGQQQRVALARALVFKPAILLLDEPMAALDRQLRQTVQVELRELQRSLKVTTVAVTHDQEEALTMSDRILVLHRGRIQQQGAPDEVYQHPCNQFVANFLGTANLLHGHVRTSGVRKELILAPAGQRLPVSKHQPEGEVVAMLRPEQVRLVRGRQESGLQGTIKTGVYFGTGTKYRVETTANLMIEASEPGVMRHAVGDPITVAWNPDDLWMLPEEGDASAHTHLTTGTPVRVR